MNKDILYKDSDFIFSYRVGGILINNGKILLQKPKNEGYSIIGGHVSRLETTAQTLEREFAEELHAPIKADELIAVGEVFFSWGNRPCHQISLYYKVHLTDEVAIPTDGSFLGFDDLDNERIDLEFCWIPLEKLPELEIYPKELIPHIMSDSGEVLHFVSNQIKEENSQTATVTEKSITLVSRSQS